MTVVAFGHHDVSISRRLRSRRSDDGQGCTMTADAVWLKGGATYMRLGSCLKVRAEHTLKLFAVYSLRLCKRSSSSCNAMADTSVDATSLMYSAPAVVSEPYPAVQIPILLTTPTPTPCFACSLFCSSCCARVGT